MCVCVSVMSSCLRPRGLQPCRLLCLWDSPGKNTGVDCHSLLQGPSPGLPHFRQSLCHLSHRGSPWYRLEGPELAIPRMRESLLLYPSCWSWPLSSMGRCGRSLSKEPQRANSAVPLDNSPGKFFPKLTQPPIGVLVCLLEKHERNL